MIYRMLCLLKSALQRFLPYTLVSHTNAHAVRGRPTLNDVERFRNGPVHELYSLKASRMCKVHTSSHEIKNDPNLSSNYENTGKNVKADLTTNGKLTAQPHHTLCIQFLDREKMTKTIYCHWENRFFS